MDAKDRKIEHKFLPTKAMLFIRILLGGYLLYTSYSLIESVFSIQGTEFVFLLLALIAFVLFGCGFIFFSLKGLKNGKYKGGAMDADVD